MRHARLDEFAIKDLAEKARNHETFATVGL